MPKSSEPDRNRTVATTVVCALARAKRTLALAESCTGGLIANQITNVPGASKVFLGGLVAYSNAAKKKFLGVRAETLARHGAVSVAVARAMAEGARKKFGSDIAVAVTGIAGPGGGTKTKPVGTVFIALSDARSTIIQHRWYPGGRGRFKAMTARQALELLRARLARE